MYFHINSIEIDKIIRDHQISGNFIGELRAVSSEIKNDGLPFLLHEPESKFFGSQNLKYERKNFDMQNYRVNMIIHVAFISIKSFIFHKIRDKPQNHVLEDMRIPSREEIASFLQTRLDDNKDKDNLTIFDKIIQDFLGYWNEKYSLGWDPATFLNAPFAAPISLIPKESPMNCVLDGRSEITKFKNECSDSVKIALDCDEKIRSFSSDGIKYGADLCLYSGDPCKYHSAFLLNSVIEDTGSSHFSDIRISDICKWTRLASNSKKASVVVCMGGKSSEEKLHAKPKFYTFSSISMKFRR